MEGPTGVRVDKKRPTEPMEYMAAWWSCSDLCNTKTRLPC